MTTASARRGIAAREALETYGRHRRILAAAARTEFAKRYSGSIAGMAWVILFPVLFLSIYVFVYLVVFRVKFPGLSDLGYVSYVFAGLVPYLAFMETVTGSAVSIRQNAHLIKNVMLPMELIPIRYVIVALVTQTVGLLVLIPMAGIAGLLGPQLLWLPLVVALQFMMLCGIALLVSALAVFVNDVSHLANLGVLLLLFVSPIGFTPEMVPPEFRWIVYGNPVYYMLEAFRTAVTYQSPRLTEMAIFAVICLLTFAAGTAFFRRFKQVLVDFE